MEEIKKEMKTYEIAMIMNIWQPKTYGISKSSTKREVCSNRSLPQETTELLNNNLTLHLNQLEKEQQQQQQNKPKVCFWKERNYKNTSRNKWKISGD